MPLGAARRRTICIPAERMISRSLVGSRTSLPERSWPGEKLKKTGRRGVFCLNLQIAVV
jgi:hypothetical protein